MNKMLCWLFDVFLVTIFAILVTSDIEYATFLAVVVSKPDSDAA